MIVLVKQELLANRRINKPKIPMNAYSYLYKYGLFKLSKRKIEKWNRMQDVPKLIFALENGLYDVRLLAAKYLGNLRDYSAVPFLRRSLHDKVKVVSLESAKSLRLLTNNPEVEIEIKEKLEEWNRIEEQAKNRTVYDNRRADIPKWKKRDWVAIVKEMLKKPMRR